MAPLRARARPGGSEAASRPAAGGTRTRLLRRLQSVRAGGEARTTRRYDQEQDVRGPRPAARAAGGPRGGRDGMEANAIHDLTAAYALDALDPEEAREYEAHLAHCDRCRSELASLSETATALAYATETSAPSPELRSRILHQARSERSNVVPLRPRWAMPVAAVAAVAACAAIGLGIWAASLSSKLDQRNETLAQSVAQQERIAELLARPDSKTVAYAHGTIALVVTGTGDAALVVRDLPDPGQGLTYEAWVADGSAPQPAGLFQGGKVVAVPLEQPVRKGATVLVTKEQKGGTTAPTSPPFITVPYRAQS